jgi:hypothetical protein
MAKRTEIISSVKKYAQHMFIMVWLSISTGCASGITPIFQTSVPEATNDSSQILFDDFSYVDSHELTANGWIVRSGQGWPGVSGATFRVENVSFVDYPNPAGNRLLRMASSTDGTSENTYQTQICHQRKYLEGTYAARVRFSDEPVLGSDGDQIVQTFYAITPYDQPLNPDYSEMDFEYLPNGGWGGPATTVHFTTWETVRIDPWLADNASNAVQGSLVGWHTLVAQVTAGTVRYFVDGQLTGQHGGAYYPDAPMSINFNLWFIEGGLNQAGEVRAYQEDIDWVFYEAGVARMPEEVNAKILQFRQASVPFEDTISPGGIPLESRCDL